ncbi:MAG TPA: outer membrane beta-barrel protein [Usitatibacter sp.]|nr:outer membrane beta-barrel protein [Usitatibacter sp.]
MSKTMTLAIAVATLAASSAFAQSIFDSTRSDRTWGHVGVSGGQSKFRTDCSTLFDCDKKDTGYKVYGGGSVNDILGFEVGYTDFGRIRAFGGETEAKAGNLSIVAGIPIGDRFNIFAKAGGVYGRTDVKASATQLVKTGDEKGWGSTWGFGGALGLTRNVQIRVDWDRYKLDFAGGRRDVDLLSAGVQMRF